MKRITVKPESSDPDSKWLVIEDSTLWGDFWDDLKRYGIRVALHNLIWQLRHS